MADYIDTEEIFNDFANRIAGSKSSFALPRSLLEEKPYSEIDVSDELERIISKSANLADIFDMKENEDLEEMDRKDEDTVIENGKYEDLSNDKIATSALSLASKLDKLGFVSLASQLDIAVAEFLGQTVKTAEEHSVERNMGQINQLVTASLEGDHWLLSHYRDNLKQKLVEANGEPEKLSAFANLFGEVAEHLGTLPELKANHERMVKASATVESLIK